MRAQHQVASDSAALHVLVFADNPLMQRALTTALHGRSDVVVSPRPGHGPVPVSAAADVVLAVTSGPHPLPVNEESAGLPRVVVSPAPGVLPARRGAEVVTVGLDSSLDEIVDTAKALVRRSQLPRASHGRRQRGRPPVRPRVPRTPHDRLTAREREVLTLLSSGTTTTDIADSLAISKHTARTHVRNILDKLEVNSRLQAGAYAARNRLV